MDDLMKKNVLSEDEVIRMMRNMTDLKQRNGSFGIGNQTQGAFQRVESTFFTGTSQDKRYDYDRNMLNVMWSSWENPDNGIDGLFGYGDDSFDGPEW